MKAKKATVITAQSTKAAWPRKLIDLDIAFGTALYEAHVLMGEILMDSNDGVKGAELPVRDKFTLGLLAAHLAVMDTHRNAGIAEDDPRLECFQTNPSLPLPARMTEVLAISAAQIVANFASAGDDLFLATNVGVRKLVVEKMAAVMATAEAFVVAAEEV